MAHAPPPPPRVRAVKRSSGIPEAADERQLVVDVHGEGDRAVDVGGVRPASAIAAATPRRPAAARSGPSAGRTRCGRCRRWRCSRCDDARLTVIAPPARNWGSTTSSTVSMLRATSMPLSTVVEIDVDQVGDEADAVVEVDEDHDAGFGVGLGRVVRHDPRVDGARDRSTPGCPTRPSGTRRTSAPAGGARCRTPRSAGRPDARRRSPPRRTGRRGWGRGDHAGHVMPPRPGPPARSSRGRCAAAASLSMRVVVVAELGEDGAGVLADDERRALHDARASRRGRRAGR